VLLIDIILKILAVEKMKGEAMKRVIVLILILFGMGIMAVAVANAEDYPCKKDVAKFCKDIKPGDGQILRCLTLYENELTPPCKKNLAQINKALEEVQKACADDYAIFCSSVLPGQGRIAACLEKNKKVLTTKCNSNLKEVMQKAREIQEQMQKK
jgi:hypothetical protein